MLIMHYHPCLNKHRTTLKQTSKYNNGRSFMTESDKRVLNFDKVVEDFCRRIKRAKTHSNDALLFDFEQIETSNNLNFLFIEFKSGSLNQREVDNIYLKLHESNDILIEMIKEMDEEYLKKHVNYILVYDIENQNNINIRESFNEENECSISKEYILEQISSLAQPVNNIANRIFPYRAGIGLFRLEGNVLKAVKTIEVNRFNYYLNYINENMFDNSII